MNANATHRGALWGLLGGSLLVAACASRFDGAPTAFVYRVDSLRVAPAACDARSGAVQTSDAPFFVVLDRTAVATAIGCASLEACERIASEGRAPTAPVPPWAYTLASFSFTEDAPPAAGACRGTGRRVRSSGAGATPFVLEISEQRFESVPRESGTAACALDVAEGQSATLPCVMARRYDATLVVAR